MYEMYVGHMYKPLVPNTYIRTHTYMYVHAVRTYTHVHIMHAVRRYIHTYIHTRTCACGMYVHMHVVCTYVA